MNIRILSLALSALALVLLFTSPAPAFDLGDLSVEDVTSIFESTETIVAGEEFTPEQEYYIGRSVSANILARYRPLHDPILTSYVNKLGQSLAMFSDRPYTFRGYHFLVLDSEEINAFAAPGGFIFVTRGLMRCCRTEDALAAVLAHEVSHVVLAHGIEAIESSRTTQAATTLAAIGAKSMTSGQIGELTDIFADSLKDITDTLITEGYSKDSEYEADAMAVVILSRSGYQPTALVEMLQAMQQRLVPGGTDFAHTHPSPEDRIEALEDVFTPAAMQPQPAPRQARFQAVVGAL